MAKKGTGSKTRAVLDFIKAHPGLGNTEIAEALTKAGLRSRRATFPRSST